MLVLLLALVGFACLDSLNVLNMGVILAIVYDSRLGRKSPLAGGLSFIAGLMAATFTFGFTAVLGLRSLTDLTADGITPGVKYWTQLVVGGLLIALASLSWLTKTDTPPWLTIVVRRFPWLLGFVGIGLGFAECATSVPYLSALTMLANKHPLPTMWPLLLIGYALVAAQLMILILALSMRQTPRALRIQRHMVRAVTRYGPIAIRMLFLCLGILFIANALMHYRML